MTRRDMKRSAKSLFRSQYDATLLGVFLTFLVSAGVNGVIPFIGGVLVLPIFVGRSRIFLDVARGKTAQIDSLVEVFKVDYADKLLTLFLKNLFLILWTLLLIVPGIIKSLSYALVPYILAEETFDPKNDKAIDESRRMMKGHKWELFVIYLSFIGWHILGVLTLGILTILYVGPYYQQTLALFYDKIKEEKGLASSISQAKIEG